MKAHTYTLMVALLASPALIAPVSASSDPEPGRTGDLVGDLLKLEQESWDHFKFFFNTYAKMCANEVDNRDDAINSMLHSALRVNRISTIIYIACHRASDKEIAPFKKVIREQKFREGIALRDKAARGIIKHIKENHYYNSDKLKRATDQLLAAIGTKYI